MQSLADNGVFLGVLLGGLVAVYFLPTIIGLVRRVDRLGLVVFLNVLGWIAWPAALAVAFGPRRRPPPPPVYPPPVPVYPPPVVVYTPQVVVCPPPWAAGVPADEVRTAVPPNVITVKAL